MDDEALLTEVRITLGQVVTELRSLVTRVEQMEKGRDKDVQQITALLTPRLEALDKNQELQREETRGLGIRMDKDLSLVETRLLSKFEAHLRENAPHDTTVGTRLGKLENAMSYTKGALAVFGLFSPVVAALLTKFLGG